MLIKHRVHGFLNRVYQSANGLFLPGGLIIPRNNNILLILENFRGKELMAAHNIVTDAGDVYYAQKAGSESPTNTFNTLYLSTVDWSPAPAKDTDTDDLASVISGGSKAVDSTYPKTNDGDADNTGAATDTLSWRFSYGKADFNDPSVDAGAIAATGLTSWGAGSGVHPVLTAFDLTAFAKTANDTLKVFVNHNFLGV